MNIKPMMINILAVKNPKMLYQISKAKKQYIITHQECALCGSTNCLECHHVIPVHIDINQATNFDNFITLCDSNNNSCHRWFGHFGNFSKFYNVNIREFAISTRMFLQIKQPDRKFQIPIENMLKEFSIALKISETDLLNKCQNILNI